MLRRHTSRILMPPQDDLNQVLRMHRYFIAAGSSFLVVGLLFACSRLGVLSNAAFYQSAALVLLSCLVYYLLFRSGLNRRFSDPSLTVHQMRTATIVILYTMYLAEGGRAVFLVVLLMIFLFGALRLTIRALVLHAAAVLAAYGVLIGLLWNFKPQSLNLHLELLQWLALALTLPWFAVMVGYISGLRNKQRRLNRALRLLSDSNITLVHAANEDQLFADLCRLVVESGGYLMAWAGVAEQDEAKSVRPIAQYGGGETYLESIRVSWDGEQDIGRGPTGTAIRTGAIQVNQDFQSNPVMAPWREAAQRHGYHSSVALPLVVDEHVLGAVMIYSAAPDAFNEEEVRLLEELANNLAYGLQSLRARGELARHHQQLEEGVAQRTREIAELNSELAVKARDAEAANRAKSAFLATMSHEIRTPLSAIVGLTGLLVDSPLDRSQRDYADKLQLSAQALFALLGDILDFSKIEAGALQLEQAPFSLNSLLHTTAAIVCSELRGKPIEALFDVAPDMPDTLIGDALRLQQILLNLTSNAVKFTEQGELVVSVQCLKQEAAQVTLQFAVRDTGIGISSEQLCRIFDVFTQSDTSTTRRYGGTGLGLAISARLADLMKGRISVASSLGQGSEFRFTVSLGLADNMPADVLAPNLTSLSILIVDDHPLARELLKKACTAFGWLAITVDSGAAALDELRHSMVNGPDYDLMLLDWHMPGMDGIEMLRQAYAAPDIRLPLVVLMAPTFEMGQAAAASDDLYFDGILAKPMTPASLLEAVRRAHAGDFTAIRPAPEKTARRLAGLRLLVAEDNPINQQVIEQILVRAGAEVVIAANGLAAVDILRSPDARFDAVLMDIQMPVMDGYAATRTIREELGRRDLPIIAVTAHALPEDRAKSHEAGMVGHLVKPIDIDDLLDIVSGGRHDPVRSDARRRRATENLIPAVGLPVVDLVGVRKIFGDDKEKVTELLRQFVAAHRNDAGKARLRFDANDINGAAEILHGLHGIANLLQTPNLARLAAAIGTALRNRHADTVPALLDELQLALHALDEFIERFDEIDDGAHSPEFDTPASPSE